MGIRIQPKEIEIPENNPFEYDLLGRKEKIEVLTRLVSNIEGPCAMAVDAAWGAGKTTFLKMWAQHLRNEGFPVVEFNAWETDFTGDPFVALSSEITEGLAEWDSPTVADKIKETKETAQKVLRWVAPGAIRLASGFIPIVGTELGKTAGDYAEELLTDYPEARQSVKEFKSELEKLAVVLWESGEHKPLVVFIDELDRCRPSYAIELLETGKHIFGVDHIVFIMAVNRAELSKSVKALYGDEFDAEGYLKRFFDIDFVLPAPNREQFINGLLDAVGIQQYLSRTNDRATQNLGQEALEVIRTFFSWGESHLSLRTIGQSIHRFGMVLSSLGDDERGYVRTLAVLTVISAIDISLYREFVSGELTDHQGTEAFFSRYGHEKLRQTPAGITVEAVIISTRVDPRYFSPFRSADSNVGPGSPLLSHYREIANGNTPSDSAGYAIMDHARQVCMMVAEFRNIERQGVDALGFQQSVQRLDLLSPDLFGTDF